MCFHHDAQISSEMPKPSFIHVLRQHPENSILPIGSSYKEETEVWTNRDHSQKDKSAKATDQFQWTVPENTDNYRNWLSREEEKELKRNPPPYDLFYTTAEFIAAYTGALWSR